MECQALKERWHLYYWNPALLMAEVGKVEFFDDWQREIMYVSARHRLTGVVGGTGVGKETILAWLMIHASLTRPFSKVWAISASESQLKNALWQELALWIDHSDMLRRMLEWRETRIVVRGHEERWRMFMQVAAVRNAGETKQAESGAGTHADHMFCGITEASGVADVHYHNQQLTMTKPDNRIVALANPLRIEGWFYEACTHASRRAKRIGGRGWYVRHVTQYDSSFTDRAATDEMVEQLGRNNPVIRAKVFAEFAEGLRGLTAFAVSEVQKMFLRTGAPDEPHVRLQIGCDPARFGDDETTIYTRRGVRILEGEAYAMTSGPECMQLCLAAAYRWWRRPCTDPRPPGWVPSEDELKQMQREVVFVIDDAGVGGMGVVDWLREFGWMVVGVNNGASPRDERHYGNLGSELWLGDAAEWVSRGYCKADEVLKRQLTRRKVKYTGKNEQRIVQAKEAMREKGIESPDRADGFVLSTARVEVPGPDDWGSVLA